MECQTNNPSLSNNTLDNGKCTEKVEWTKEQDWFIKNMIKTYGTRDWKVIAEKVNRRFPNSFRSSKQCRYRLLKYIKPSFMNDSWSDKEDVELLLAHYKFKKNWSDVSRVLGGRNRNSVRNRFYLIFRRVKHKIKKSDYSYTSNIDILQTHYILFVMKNYLSKAIGPEYMAQMASRDSTYKLLQQITLEMVTDYASKFQERTISYSCIQELFENILTEFEPANIEIPEDPLEESSINIGAMDEEPLAVMETDIKAKGIFIDKEPLSFESMAIEGPSIKRTQEYSPRIFSADTTATAKAPDFYAELEDFGFSEYIEKNYQTVPPDLPEAAIFSQIFTNNTSPEVTQLQ